MTAFEVVPALLAGLLAALAGLGLPRVIARLPEPPPREPVEGEPHEPVEPVEPVEPKELYAAIAVLPGLARKTAIASGVAGLLVGGSVGWTWDLLILLPLVPVGVALALIDWRTCLLPTRLIAPSYVWVLVVIAVAFVVDRDRADLFSSLLGWALFGGMFFVLWFVYPPGLGYGDVRLAGLLGLALGHLDLAALLLGAFSGSVLNAICGVLLVKAGVVDRKDNPFGPYLVIGALIGILCGTAVLGTY